MGIILPCTLPCQLSNEKVSDQSKLLSTVSSSDSSLSSQPSLPSIPSLNPPFPSLGPIQSVKAVTENTATLSGHSSYVFSLALNGNHHLYSGCSSGEIRHWNVHCSSGRGEVCRLYSDQHTNFHNNVVAKSHSAVKSIAFLSDKLLTAHHDHKIRVWKILENYKTALKKYKCIATLPTLKDSCIKLFSAKNYVEVRRHKKCTWVHHIDAVSALALSKDNTLLYSVSWDRTFKVWRTSDFKCLESVWNAHNDAINAIALSNDGYGYVYTGSADKTIKIWKKQTTHKHKQKHSLVATLEKHKSAVNALALSIDGSLLYSGACDRSIIVWGKDSAGDGNMTVIGALRGHKKAILCLSVVDDLVCSGSADKTVRIWRREIANSHSCLSVLEGHNGPIKCLAAATATSENDAENLEKSCFVYSGSLDCNIKVWKISV